MPSLTRSGCRSSSRLPSACRMSRPVDVLKRRPRRLVRDREAQRSRLRDRWPSDGTNTSSRRTPSSRACRKSSAADWPPARAHRHAARAKTQANRRSRAGTSRHERMWTLRANARNFHDQARAHACAAASTRVWQGKWRRSARVASGRLHANGLLESSPPRQPRYPCALLSAQPRTGGFASPSFDGFALGSTRAVCPRRAT